MDKEKRELAVAGPTARIMLTDTCQRLLLANKYSNVHVYEKKRTWLKPFVAPRDARLGVAADIKIKMAPESKRQLVKRKPTYRVKETLTPRYIE